MRAASSNTCSAFRRTMRLGSLNPRVTRFICCSKSDQPARQGQNARTASPRNTSSLTSDSATARSMSGLGQRERFNTIILTLCVRFGPEYFEPVVTILDQYQPKKNWRVYKNHLRPSRQAEELIVDSFHGW